MMGLIIFICFVIFLSATQIRPASSAHSISKRSTSECGSELEFLDCFIMDLRQLSRRVVNKFKARYVQDTTNCKIVNALFDWRIDFPDGSEKTYLNYTGRETFLLKPFTTGTGFYPLSVMVNEIVEGEKPPKSEDDYDLEFTADCAFEIVPEPPVAIIEEGLARVTELGEDFKVDGSNSIDMRVRRGSKGNLLYRWSCTVSNKEIEKELCNESVLGNDAFVVVPAKFTSIQGVSFKFLLEVRVEDTEWVNATQTIVVQEKQPILKLTCLNNCPPLIMKTNVAVYTKVEVSCVKNCELMTENPVEWNIDPSIDEKKYLEIDDKLMTFFIAPHGLLSGTKYSLSVYIKGFQDAKTIIELDASSPPYIKSCSISPEEGIALETKFLIDCTQEEGNYRYEIFSLNNHTEVLLVSGGSLIDMSFVLGTVSRVKVRITDRYQLSNSRTLKVSIKPMAIGSKEDLVKKLREIFSGEKDSVRDMLEKKRFEEAIQIMDGLTDILENVTRTYPDIAKEYQKTILNTLLDEIPLNFSIKPTQLAGIATKIGKLYQNQPENNIVKLVLEVCAKASNVSLKDLKKNDEVKELAVETKKTAGLFTNCSQVGTQPNYGDLKPGEYNEAFLETYQEPPLITEVYPDYIDDQNISKALKNYAASTDSMIELCYTTSDSLVITMIPHEPTKYVNTENFEVTATMIEGEEFNTTVNSQNVTLTSSEDLKKYTNFSVLMCTSKDNPFWWNGEILGRIVYLNYKVNDTGYFVRFNKPFTIKFYLDKNFTQNLYSNNGTTPSKFKEAVNFDEDNFEHIRIYRIDRIKNQGYIVEFLNLTNSTLDVYISHFEKVCWSTFQNNAKTVTHNTSKIFVNNTFAYNSWDYLHIFPSNQSTRQEKTVNFQFSVYSFSCNKWDSCNRQWLPTCKAYWNLEYRVKDQHAEHPQFDILPYVECFCNDAAVYTANVSNLKIKTEKTLIAEYELELQASNIICYSVVAIYAIYCFLICAYSFFKKTSEKRAYFLGDIPYTYKYGYLLIVKTGNKRNAGTTSNVLVKLYGTKSASDRHLLNYPDPEKKILQKNQEDWFFLASKEHLGQLTKIEIWFDSLGLFPNWYCSEIAVIDLQENIIWYFNVKFQFKIDNAENSFHTAFPDEAVTKKKLIADLMSNPFEGIHSWNIFAHDEECSVPYKLTLILSIFLMTYLLILVFYGFPTLTNSDILSDYIEYTIDARFFLIAIGSSVLTFGVHYPITHCYRKFNKKTIINTKLINATVPTICWYILSFLIILSMTLLIIFGFWVPYITGLLWLTASLVSLFIYAVVFENIALFIKNVILLGKAKTELAADKIRSVLDYVELQRRMLYEKFGSGILRPYIEDVYEPLSKDAVKEKQYQYAVREQIVEVFEDLITIIVYVVLLYSLIVYDKDPYIYKNYKSTEDLVQGVYTRVHYMERTDSQKAIYNYTKNAFIFSLQAPSWYGRRMTEPALTIDNNNKFIGVARIRQHRSNNASCTTNAMMKFLNMTCKAGYDIGPEYKNFSESWGNVSESDRFARMDNVWKYTTASMTNTPSYSGNFARYPGGGYIALLGRTITNSFINVNYLKNTKWIDGFTRCISIEILLYSPNSNLFNAVRVQFEIHPSGYVRPTLNVQTAKLLYVHQDTSILVWSIFTLFFIAVIALLVKVAYRVVYRRKLYFKDLMNLLDVLIIILSVICFFLYLERSKLVNKFLITLKSKKHNVFVAYFNLFYAEYGFTLLTGLLVFVATFRLWKLLKFFVIIRVVEKTITLSTAPLLCVFLWQLLLNSCYSVAGMLLFGDRAYEFRDIKSTLVTLMVVSLGLKENFNFDIFTSGLHFLYYSSYTLCSILIYNFYITIITISYQEAQLYYSSLDEYTVFEYIKEQVSYYWNFVSIRWKNMRLSGGEDIILEQKMVYPKTDEFRYAQCLTIRWRRMKGMICNALHILRSPKTERTELDEREFNLIKRIIVNLFWEKEGSKQVFFIAQLEGVRKTLFSNEIFLNMEKITSFMLQKDKDEKRNTAKEVMENQNRRMNKISNNLDLLNDILKQIDTY